MNFKLKRFGATALAMLMVLSVLAMPAAAALTSAPAVDSSSDIDDGVTISIVDADDTTASTLVVNTDNNDTIDSAEVTIETAASDRDYTVYTSDDTADDYTMDADVDTDGDGSADSDQHTWNITHDEFADAPVDYNSSVDLEFTATFTDDSGNEGNVTGTFTLQNDGDRSVMVADTDAVETDGVGPDVSSYTDEPGYLAQAMFWSESEETEYFAAEDTRSINDSNTTIEVYAADSDFATSFEDQLGDDVEEGDLLVGEHAAQADDDFPLVFYQSADTDIVDENETYVVYDDSADKLTYHLGDDYDSASSVDVWVASNNALDDEFDFDSENVADAYSANLEYSDLKDEFGTLTTIWTLSVWPASVPVLGAAAIVVSRRRLAA